MLVKNDYNECLTNLACSIRKYFDLEYKHNSLDYIDKILQDYKPKNVITILFDGMGSNILDRMLNKTSFLIKNRIKPIYTVFPPTTVACTTSILTGLNPVESGMIAWDMYYKDLDKIVSVYTNCEKEDETQTPLKEAEEFNKKYMLRKTIGEEINEVGKYKAYELYSFDNSYVDLDDMFNKIENYCNEEGKKYIYAYNDNPDHTMHKIGCDKKEIKDIIEDINNRVETLSKKLEDTIIFVIADHGQHNIDNIHLWDYPDIEKCLLRNVSMDPRSVNFFIKPDKKEEFAILFNKYFGNDFDLYDMDDVIESKLFGDGKENPIYRDSLGDYLAIGKTDKALVYYGTKDFKSHHSGYTEDEILIPLIVIKTDK